MEEQAKSNLLKLQKGGSADKRTTPTPRKPSLTKEVTPDNTRVKPNLLSKIKPTDYTIKNQLGVTLKPGDAGFWDRAKTVNEYRGEGELTATRDLSPREKLLVGIQKLNSYSMAPGGTSNNLTPAFTETVAAGARMLRPDKSYRGLHEGSVGEFEDSAKQLGWDALALLPAAGYIKGVAKAPFRAVRSAGEAVEPYLTTAKKTFKATADLPLGKRLKNAANSGTLGKSMPGDINSRSYFAMTPDDVAGKMKQELQGMPLGAATTEQSLSLNSHPIFWNQASRGGKDWTIIRNGPIDELNSSGIQGKRVYNAMPEQIKIQNAPIKEMADHRLADLKDRFKQGIMGEQHYQLKKANVESELNSHMLTEIAPIHGNSYWWREFLDNYKPTLDNPIAAVNAKTGLNFPMTTIKKTQGREFYRSPQLTAVKGMKDRWISTLEGVADATKQNYILNKRLELVNKMPKSVSGLEVGASPYDALKTMVNTQTLPHSRFKKFLTSSDSKFNEGIEMQKLFLQSTSKGGASIRPIVETRPGNVVPTEGDMLPPPPDEIRF